MQKKIDAAIDVYTNVKKVLMVTKEDVALLKGDKPNIMPEELFDMAEAYMDHKTFQHEESLFLLAT